MEAVGIGSRTRRGARLWDGYYINLDRAGDRRRRMEEELRRYGLIDRYQRFAGIDGRALNRPSPRGAGEVGIFRSHLDVLRMVAASGRPAHVIEDDVSFCDLSLPVIEAVVRGPLLREFDIVYLETYVGWTVAAIRKFHHEFQQATRKGPVERADQFRILDLGAGYQGGSTSYLISPSRAGKLAEGLEHEWARGPTMPVDTFVKNEVEAGRLRVGCMFPFATTVDMESSWVSSADRNELRGRPILELLIRYAFFVRQDIRGHALPMLDRVLAELPPPETGDALEMCARIVQYYLTCPPVR